MNSKSMKLAEVVVPVLVITVGVGALLTARHIVPGVDWVWTLGLGVVGILVLLVGGVTKVTVVFGPLLIASSVLSILRQTGRLGVETEMPVLVIIVGVLMFIGAKGPWPDSRSQAL